MPIDLRTELEPSVARLLDRHLADVRDWMPHDLVPWSLGWDFDSSPWHPGQSRLPAAARTALGLLLAAEDDLPRRHAVLATAYGDRGAWARWLHRWTAEEQRHGLALRDYLLTSRAADPAGLEAARLRTLCTVRERPARDLAGTLAHLVVEQTAAAVRYRAVPEVPDCCGLLLERIAGDKEAHARFHRALLDDALLIDPSRTVSAICAELLTAGARPHPDLVVRPLAEHWGLTGATGPTGLDADAVRHLDALDAFLNSTRPAALTAGGSL